MTYRELVTEAWETVKDATRPAAMMGRVTWRAAFGLLRRSIGPAILERFVGLVVMAAVIVGFVELWALLVGLMRK